MTSFDLDAGGMKADPPPGGRRRRSGKQKGQQVGGGGSQRAFFGSVLRRQTYPKMPARNKLNKKEAKLAREEMFRRGACEYKELKARGGAELESHTAIGAGMTVSYAATGVPRRKMLGRQPSPKRARVPSQFREESVAESADGGEQIVGLGDFSRASLFEFASTSSRLRQEKRAKEAADVESVPYSL